MSSSYCLTRMRWAAKEMRLLKWLKGAGEYCQHGEPLCVVSLDGRPTSIPFYHDEPPAAAGIYYTLVNEGDEVGPSGALIEYAMGRRLADIELHQSVFDDLGLRPPRVRLERRRTYCPIFMSYRREDSEAYAGRLHESLETEFGPDAVFMDLFGTQPGDHYEWAIQQACAHALAMIVVIGPRWVSIEKDGFKRLGRRGDLLTLEVGAALQRRIAVLPVYVGNAELLKRSDLPTTLHGLEMCQAFRLTAEYWSTGVAALKAAIRKTVATAPVKAFEPQSWAVSDQWTDFGALS